MMAVLLVAGIGLVLAGLLAIGFGIPVKEFSFGNTLIVAGAIAACAGAILIGLSAVVRELKIIARRVGPGPSAESHAEATVQSAAAGAAPRNQAAEDGGFLFSRDQPAANVGSAEPAADSSAASPAEAAPAVKPRRNLLFSSSSRKERERAEARAADPSMVDHRPHPAAPPPPAESSEAPPATFDDAWPKPERARGPDAPPQRRSGRAPSSFTDPSPGATGADRSAPRHEEQPPVTVLKSGVVDGMAYSLYSDGSIEAQMPEGMMRFASIEELRAHLDQRS
jgi:hypothetical protein